MVAPETPCGARVECTAGEQVFCLCPNGSEGAKECLRDGSGFTECALTGGEPCPIGGSEAPASSGNGMGGSVGMGGSSSTGAGASGPGCTHDVCEVGDPLGAECDTCTAAVCGFDDYCCTTFWDSTCVLNTGALCDNICNPPPPMCEHSPCDEGVAMTDTCDPCVMAVCGLDAMCCNNAWDNFCVTDTKNGALHPECSGVCCAHKECDEGPALDATCSACATAVCAIDAWCCNNTWDQFCVEKAVAEPSCNCPSM